jgi:hypothetical protein
MLHQPLIKKKTKKLMVVKNMHAGADLHRGDLGAGAPGKNKLIFF